MKINIYYDYFKNPLDLTLGISVLLTAHSPSPTPNLGLGHNSASCAKKRRLPVPSGRGRFSLGLFRERKILAFLKVPSLPGCLQGDFQAQT